jgi:TolA-binding protein
MPDEKGYMDKGFCMDCLNKHLSRAEHHGEDFITGTRDDPELRQQAQEMLDQIRDMRKRVDNLRIEALARKKIEEAGI